MRALGLSRSARMDEAPQIPVVLRLRCGHAPAVFDRSGTYPFGVSIGLRRAKAGAYEPRALILGTEGLLFDNLLRFRARLLGAGGCRGRQYGGDSPLVPRGDPRRRSLRCSAFGRVQSGWAGSTALRSQDTASCTRISGAVGNGRPQIPSPASRSRPRRTTVGIRQQRRPSLSYSFCLRLARLS
ncbi:hypothetical protein BJ546DRAFT_127213 [Cryomyces antarcticus]